MELLIVLMLGLALVVGVPLLLLKLFFGALGFAIALPFRLAGAVLHLVAGVGKLVLGVAGLALLVFALPVLVIAIPALLFFGCIFIGVKVLAAIAC